MREKHVQIVIVREREVYYGALFSFCAKEFSLTLAKRKRLFIEFSKERKVSDF